MENSEFLGPNYFLSNKVSEVLFHEIAHTLPIVDYHNHLNVSHLATNYAFKNIGELWVSKDPYKHRAMRINGIPEKYISGDSTDKEKFMHWAKTLPKTMGNPLFHWSCIELDKVFGIKKILTESTAESIWNNCNEQLQDSKFAAIPLLENWNIDTLCTSDYWFDDLSLHKKTSSQAKFNVLPSLRSDIANNISLWKRHNFIENLAIIYQKEINSLTDFQSALHKQLHHFNENGCKLSDHALDSGFVFVPTSESVATPLFKTWITNQSLSNSEIIQLQSYILAFLGKEYAKLGWTMQLHIGAQRHTSSRLRKLAGSSGGFAGIGTAADIASICSFLNLLESEDCLPNVILYTLNPSDNEAFASLTGSFSQEGKPGKIQFGPAWWYNDHFDGIKSNLLTIANYSLLSRFVGMTTDSRSILSFSRHEYFRRILCNIVGEWVNKGLLPNDMDLLKDLITAVCYTNSKQMIANGK
ncbi:MULTISPECIES: glucuronate isomerase [unclassified Flavobacterium]|jgi:glucuronate isomerase|uniref:glucuronate isomerase n=1 Tax=unclassified Flavobacterium TaxID=196869 RepID=UPI0025BEC13F|nr:MULTISPECIES: glucuronate isomerase [unclassified Flavobacterium]